MRGVRRSLLGSLPVLILPLAGCATHHAPSIVAQVPPPPVAIAAPLPPGATPGMLVPQALADGSFPTPNRGLTGDAAIWHLRAGLNVAALSCPGVEGAAIRAGYNGWLRRDKAALARVATGYAAQYTAGGYDDAMTRLYNFFSQTPVRPAFCTAAAGIVAEMASDTAVQPVGVEARLATLDRPFGDFYRAYAAWRDGSTPRTVIAAAAVAPASPLSRTAAFAAIVPPRRPTLTLDLSTLPADTEVSTGR